MDIAALSRIPVYRRLFAGRAAGRAFAGRPQLEKRHIMDGFPKNWMTPALRRALAEDALEFTTTSGTTSDRMQVMRKKGWWKEEYARTYARHPLLQESLRDGAHKAILTTAICSSAVCYRENPTREQRTLGNTLYLNIAADPNAWTRADVERMLEELESFKPVYLDADPVYLALLLRHKESYGIRGKPYLPKILTLSYEYVSAATRRYIERHFSCVVRNLYGTTEFGYLFLEDSAGRMQLCPELAGVDFDPVDAERGIYALIVHSRKNEYMPLFNYRVGDLAELSGRAPEHGAVIKRICGREKDLLRRDDGAIVTTAEVDDAVSAAAKDVIAYQIVAGDEGRFMLRYLTAAGAPLGAAQSKRAVQGLSSLLRARVEARHERAISPSPSGKFEIMKKATTA